MTGLTGVAGSAGLGNASASGSVSGSQTTTPFAGMFRSMVDQTNALDQKAAETVTGLLNGQGVDIHEAMIATQKADMAFELALQVRNKAVAAYQQMMGMQF
jgi:flagellar hook-basal body complex protein FliE